MKPKEIFIPLSHFNHGKITGSIIIDIRREKDNGLYPIRYRITFNRKQVYYKSGYDATKREWKILPTTKTRKLIEKRELIKSGFEIIEDHVKQIKDSFSFEVLNRRMGRGKAELVSVAFDSKILDLNKSGQVGTASIYNSAKLIFEEYKEDLKFIDITSKFLDNFEQYAIKKIRYTTLGMYLRCLRTLYNIAIADEVVSASSYPFQKKPNDKKYKIKQGSGTKIALTIEQLKKFIDYQPEFSAMKRSKDLFMLSFYLGGINIKDLLLLKWENIEQNEIVYTRSKTIRTTNNEKKIRIPLNNNILTILNKHGNTDRSLKARILPFMPLDATPLDVRRITLNVLRKLNRDLDKIGEKLKIDGLSSYVARHTIATLMKNSGVSESFIKEMLGHSNIKTTENYLKSFEHNQNRKTHEKFDENLKLAMNAIKIEENGTI
ncbi:MAG: tyrosine-type recombinase/integrase [Bacteroidales bacterium]